jgi:hypothetical protein
MQQPSRFLEEIPDELVDEWNLRRSRSAQPGSPRHRGRTIRICFLSLPPADGRPAKRPIINPRYFTNFSNRANAASHSAAACGWIVVTSNEFRTTSRAAASEAT